NKHVVPVVVAAPIAEEVLPALVHGFSDTAYLDTSRLPGWEHIVHHKGDAIILEDIAELLGLAHRPAANVDGIQFRIVAKANRRILRLTVWTDRRQPPKPL